MNDAPAFVLHGPSGQLLAGQPQDAFSAGIAGTHHSLGIDDHDPFIERIDH